jgi:hypothetical protein
MMSPTASGSPATQFGHKLRVLPGGQPGFGQRLPDPQPQQVKALGLLLKPGHPGHIRQRPPPPQVQCPAQLLCRLGGLGRPHALGQQPLGFLHVRAVPAQVQQVAGGLCQDRALVAKYRPQV